MSELTHKILAVAKFDEALYEQKFQECVDLGAGFSKKEEEWIKFGAELEAVRLIKKIIKPLCEELENARIDLQFCSTINGCNTTARKAISSIDTLPERLGGGEC